MWVWNREKRTEYNLQSLIHSRYFTNRTFASEIPGVERILALSFQDACILINIISVIDTLVCKITEIAFIEYWNTEMNRYWSVSCLFCCAVTWTHRAKHIAGRTVIAAPTEIYLLDFLLSRFHPFSVPLLRLFFAFIISIAQFTSKTNINQRGAGH